MSDIKRAKISGPTPKPVLDAIATVQKYLRQGGWVEVIISAQGGAAFKLTSIYDDLLEALEREQAS